MKYIYIDLNMYLYKYIHICPDVYVYTYLHIYKHIYTKSSSIKKLKSLQPLKLCTLIDPDGVVHHTVDYPGIPVDHTTITKKYDILKDIRIPIRAHFGTIGL